MKSFKRKQSLYFPHKELSEMERESARQDRSMSWIMQTAWRLAKARIQEWPAAPLRGPGELEDSSRDISNPTKPVADTPNIGKGS